MLSPAELEVPLLGARLAWLVYATSRQDVEAGLKLLGLRLICFERQRVRSAPQWLLARDERAMYIVIRGTSSAVDVCHDLMAAPAAAAAGGNFHSGFLRGARAVAEVLAPDLQAELLSQPCEKIFLIGHSLGGAVE